MNFERATSGATKVKAAKANVKTANRSHAFSAAQNMEAAKSRRWRLEPAAAKMGRKGHSGSYRAIGVFSLFPLFFMALLFALAAPSAPAQSLGEAVDNTALTWITGGNASWYGQTSVAMPSSAVVSGISASISPTPTPATSLAQSLSPVFDLPTLRDLIISMIFGKSSFSAADQNADGIVDVSDCIKAALFSPTPTPSPTATPSPTSSPSPSPTPIPNTITIILPGGVSLELLRIPSGSFQMGSDDPGWSLSDEQPVHTVTISQAFYMGKFEVTQAQWQAVMGNNPSYFTGDLSHPVEQVSWNDIAESNGFIAKLNQYLSTSGHGGYTVRLPSEAEWEYACRAGSTTRFYYGNSNCPGTGCDGCDLSQYAWWCGNNKDSIYGTKPAGGKLPNDFRLYDMHGNVWEWCEDWYHESYTGAPVDGSAWLVPTGSYKVLRGSAWNGAPQACRSADRGGGEPDLRSYFYGFRVVGVVRTQ